jgi:hypothetical protein
MTDKTPAGVNNPVLFDHCKLWINNRWYIPVDTKGRVKGTCAEGAVGFVIQLHSAEDASQHLALKIPRLMGETRRENAYINELSEKELRAVRKVFHTLGGKNCLLNADVAHGSILRGPISTQSGTKDAQQWDGALVFVCYEKGQNPTFRLVKFDGQKPKYYPDTNDFSVSYKDYETIKEKARGTQGDWERAVFVEGNEAPGSGNTGATSVFSIEEALSSDTSERTWYTCLPSILYNWAPETLQESISLDHRKGPWDKSKHFALIERVCRGIDALHSKEMLHADVRPANIVYEGEASEPDSYSLSDYGSFADPGARPSDHNPNGQTVLGPVVSGERVSAFYAPERRHSREREAANTAVIHNPGSSFLYVILGWNSDLIDPGIRRPKESIKKLVDRNYLKQVGDLRDDLARSDNAQRDERLQKGDRIQIREYIFDVEEEWNVEDKQILKCTSKVWKVYHGRIVVESTDKFLEWDYFPIPRTVELQQWQAATDLYSLGALALYSVFSDSIFKKQDAKEDNQSNEDRSKLEEDFRDMLNYLDSKPYFNAIWPELEWMRKTLEDNLQRPNLTETTFADLDFVRYTGDKPREDEEKKLKGAVVKLVGRITQSVPGALHIVEALNYDLGTFILFFHFVLCCLHRQSEVKREFGAETKVDEIGPFAKDRLERPAADGATSKALKRIVQIQKLSQDRLFGGLKLEPNTDEIPPFDPRPTSTIRVVLDQTRKELGETNEKLKKTEARLKTCEGAVDTALGFTQNKLTAAIHIKDIGEALNAVKSTGS